MRFDAMTRTSLLRYLWGILFLVLLTAAAWWLWGPKKTLPQFLTVTVKKADIENSVLATGSLEPLRQVNVGAQVSGQIKQLYVKLGDTVKKGQLLAEIDPVLQENALKKAQASIASVKAQLQANKALIVQYRQDFVRQQAMAKADAVSTADLQQAQAQLATTMADHDVLEAQLAQANIELDTAKANLGYTRITAPMSGVVIAVVTKEGQTVVSAQSAPTILILANLDTMTVKAQISEADVTKVEPGQKVYFTTLGNPDKRYYATLRSVEPAPTTVSDAASTGSANVSTASSSEAVYYYGLFDVPNPNHVLHLAMTAEVHIIQSEARDVLTIPISQLGRHLGTNRYQVMRLEHGHPVPVTITIGVRDNVNVQVLSGLKAGYKLVVGNNALKYTGDEHRRRRPFGL